MGESVDGRWMGQVADMLGLPMGITREAFSQLCDNKDPVSGDKLTPRTRSMRRVGYDFTFNASKSVSLLFSITGDERIEQAMREAVQETMRQAEERIQTRVRKGRDNSADENRPAQGLLWAEFMHDVARPVGGMPDPHLHIHAYAFNVTYDPKEARFKAGQFGDILRDAPLYEAVFHSILAEKLSALGYPIARGSKYAEIEGVPRSLVEKFSRRSKQIEEAAAKLGITTDEGRDNLAATTRGPKKEGEQNEAARRENWWGRLSDEENRILMDLYDNATGGSETPTTVITPPSLTAEDAVRYALSHRLSRQSVTSEEEVMVDALRRSYGELSVGAVRKALEHAPVIKRKVGQVTMLTTEEVYREEEALITKAKEARGTCELMGPKDYAITNKILNQGQLDALTALLQTRDRVSILRGGAGTGKTTLLHEFVKGVEANGKHILALAPTAAASRGVLREEGFDTADTVARFLHDEELQQSIKGQVLVVDEAGMLGVADTLALVAITERMGARLVLVGDTRQHSSVARGDALRLLEERGGLVPAEMNEIVRQRGEYRDLVGAIQGGDVVAGIRKLEELGNIVEGGDRYRNLVTDYLDGLTRKKSMLVVAPTNREAKLVTSLLRDGLRAAGRLGDEERVFDQYKATQWTEAEMSDARRYQLGQIVIFHKASLKASKPDPPGG